VTLITSTHAAAAKQAHDGLRRVVRRNPLFVLGAGLLLILIALAFVGPFVVTDPLAPDPFARLQGPSANFLLGTDNLGRDVLARTVYGARVSLAVGLGATGFAIVSGLIIGLVAGFARLVDAIGMRIMDGIMAIPTILLAIALVSLTRGGVVILMVAIAIPQIPGIARLVRSVVLSTRERPYVEAAFCGGASVSKVLWRHILPSAIPPLVVQSTYVCANAILIEAGLSFLGAGVPPEIPSWGNMIAESRIYLSIVPWAAFAPSLCLSTMILAVSLLGDGLRKYLDPRQQ
jgi:peptide/nickel transport system permease protein